MVFPLVGERREREASGACQFAVHSARRKRVGFGSPHEFSATRHGRGLRNHLGEDHGSDGPLELGDDGREDLNGGVRLGDQVCGQG